MAHEMAAGRNLATATLISGSCTELDGQVLIAGGEDVNFTTPDTAEAEPRSDRFGLLAKDGERFIESLAHTV
jgi:hypothetical protein